MNDTQYHICIVQGDTEEYYITLIADDIELIPTDVSHLYFSSRNLNITKELLWDDEKNAFILSFTSDETKTFPKGKHSWDLTLYTTDSAISTCIYEDIIQVFPKKNEVTTNE